MRIQLYTYPEPMQQCSKQTTLTKNCLGSNQRFFSRICSRMSCRSWGKGSSTTRPCKSRSCNSILWQCKKSRVFRFCENSLYVRSPTLGQWQTARRHLQCWYLYPAIQNLNKYKGNKSNKPHFLSPTRLLHGWYAHTHTLSWRQPPLQCHQHFFPQPPTLFYPNPPLSLYIFFLVLTCYPQQKHISKSWV